MTPEITALFVERFPRYAFALRDWRPGTRTKKSQDPKNLPLDLAQILYLYGLDAATALQLMDWLSANASRRLIFLEPDTGQIASFLEHPAAEKILSQTQIEIYHLPKQKAKATLLEELSRRYPQKGMFVCYCRGSRQEFARLKLQLMRKSALSNAQVNDKLLTHLLLSNLRNNCDALPSTFYVNRMKDAFASIPAIICGAGPSLQRSLETLKSLQQRALIIAGGSAIAALSKHGIEPHFAVAIDPNPEEFERIKNSFAFQTPFLFSLRLHNSCLAATNGPLGYIRSGMSGLLPLWLEQEIGLKDPLIGQELPTESLSVSMLSAALAHHFGCNPILFEGMDLAYTENRRYADGVDAEEKEPELTQPVDRLLDKRSRKGKKVSSAVRWVMEANSLSKYAKLCNDRRWIQCTSDGLAIKGIESMPLEEAASLFPQEKDLYGLVHQAISAAPMPEEILPLLSQKSEEIANSLDRLLEHLDNLVQNRPGLAILAELEMQEELAYKILFYDIERTLGKALLGTDDKTAYWQLFQQLVLRCKRAWHPLKGSAP